MLCCSSHCVYGVCVATLSVIGRFDVSRSDFIKQSETFFYKPAPPMVGNQLSWGADKPDRPGNGMHCWKHNCLSSFRSYWKAC